MGTKGDINFIMKKFTDTMNKNIWFILTQFFSELGSTITSFGIILWINQKNPNPLIFSLLSISVFLPKILFGIVIGSIIDRFEKKKIILYADFVVMLSSLGLLILFKFDIVNIPLILFLNFFSGTFSCLQDSSKNILNTIIFSKEEFIKLNGLISFLSGVAMLLSPILGAILYNKIGMNNIILLDIGTFLIAFMTLFFMKVPKENLKKVKFNLKQIFIEFKFSYNEIKKIKDLRNLMFFFFLVNLFSGMTYFSLISPLILSRTNNNAEVLGLVNMFLGLGFILGGMSVSLFSFEGSKEKIIYIAVAFSFILGDILLAMGQTPIIWYFGAFFAAYFIPFSDANKAYIWRDKVPLEHRGKIFACRNTFESISRPIGMLLGGLTVEKFLSGFASKNSEKMLTIFNNIDGANIGLLFIFTGLSGFLACIYCLVIFLKKQINYQILQGKREI